MECGPFQFMYSFCRIVCLKEPFDNTNKLGQSKKFTIYSYGTICSSKFSVSDKKRERYATVRYNCGRTVFSLVSGNGVWMKHQIDKSHICFERKLRLIGKCFCILRKYETCSGTPSEGYLVTFVPMCSVAFLMI